MSKSKAWWKSKTLLVNAVSLTLIGVQTFQGAPWFSPEVQAAIIAVLNAVLRLLTGQPLELPKRSNTATLVLACALALGAFGCATKSATSQSLSVADAAEQYAGATTAIATLSADLPTSGPTAASVETVSAIQGYAAWAGVALQALGIVAKVAGM
ncbi:MAG: hypothetical protein AB7E51_18975 [Pseudodesulfovibrio sp.]|uniref:hypothetical protein n=1 Tax=Pseudodesulfovibrio sp. TaxID=2035812 RepID=UPI003D115AC9